MRVEKAEFLGRVYRSIAQAWGAPPHQAEAFSRAILAGDLVGQIAQGIAITQLDHMMVTNGQVNLKAEPTIENEGPSFAVMNGHRGLGQYTMTCAMEKAIEKAKSNTIGAVWVYNWHDIGCASAYSRLALDHNMVGLVTVNSVPLTAPFGGRDMLMSAAPFSFVCPASGEHPIIGDIALCQIYDYHMSMAIEEDRTLDGKWLVDPESGELTDDPKPYLMDPTHRSSGQIAAVAFPDPKLYAMNIFAEILTGLLTPGGWTSDKHEYPSRPAVEAGVQVKRGGGGFCLAINVENLMPLDMFTAKADEWMQIIKSSQLQAGSNGIRIPGHRALEEEQRRLRDGVPVRDDNWDALVAMAKEAGVDIEALR